MRCSDFVELLNEIAPFSTAEKWDNSGFQIGDLSQDINKVMLALDPTEDVIAQAIEEQCDMLITHHPLIFSGEKNIVWQDEEGKRIMSLIQNGVAYCAMHTNYDSTCIARDVADRIGLPFDGVMQQAPGDNEMIGLGVVGTYPEELTIQEIAERIKEYFGLESVRLYGNPERKVKKVAVLPGGGGDEVGVARATGAELYITGDVKHHQALEGVNNNMAVMDATHYGLEYIFAEGLKERLLERGVQMEIITDVDVPPYWDI